MDAQDPDDYPEAFDRYAPVILRYAQRRLENPDAAWDVVTDTFTSAWRHWDRRPGPAELLPWLYAIAGNSVRDQRRSTERRRRLVARLSAVPGPRHAADPADGVVLGQSISAAVARLPEADREVLRLIAWEGQTDAHALGLVLGLSPGAARSRVHRARRRLRAALADAELAHADRTHAGTIHPDTIHAGADGAEAGEAPADGPLADGPARITSPAIRPRAKEA